MIINSIQPTLISNQNIKVINSSIEITSTATNNIIQVYPVVAMSKWTISPTEPTSPITNEVWLSDTGTSIYTIQPFSKYNLTIGISGAKQWDGTSWTTISTKCYYNNQWNPSS